MKALFRLTKVRFVGNFNTTDCPGILFIIFAVGKILYRTENWLFRLVVGYEASFWFGYKMNADVANSWNSGSN